MGGPYGNLFSRLVANSRLEHDNEQSCWVSTFKDRCRYGYTRVGIYVPGLGRKVKLMTHIVSWLLMTQSITHADDLYLAYVELRCSGLEVDHGCVNAPCMRPDHLEPVTKAVNCQRRNSRRAMQEWRQAPAQIQLELAEA